MKIFRHLLLTLIISGSVFSLLFAGDYGGYAGAFLRMGLGARPKALGGAFTAIAEGNYAGYYNPGGLPRNNYRELSLSYRALSLDRQLGYAGIVIPLTPKTKTGKKAFNAGLHLGWIYAGVDNIDGRNSRGEHYGSFSNSENAFTFGFAIQPMSMLSLGFTTKILYSRFPRMTLQDESLTSKGLGFDVGALVTPLPGLSLGIVVKDLRSKNSWNTENVWDRGTTTYDEFPTILRVGIAYRLLADQLLLAADFEDNKKQPGKLHLGIEYSPLKTLFLRAGISSTEPAFGFGYLFKIWRFNSALDYAYAADEVAPAGEHIFSWSFRL